MADSPTIQVEEPARLGEVEQTREEKIDVAFGEAVRDLAHFKRRNAMMLRRMRNLAIGTTAAFLLSVSALSYAVWSNTQRLTDIQQTRTAAIIYACRQQNQAHVKTLIFLDKTELVQLHKPVGPQHYPVIERHTLHVLHAMPYTKRAAALANHRVLLAFLDNLAPYQSCLNRARALSTGQTRPH